MVIVGRLVQAPDGTYKLNLTVGTPAFSVTVPLDADIGDFPAIQATEPQPVPGLDGLWAYRDLIFNEPTSEMPEALIRRRILVAYAQHSS